MGNFAVTFKVPTYFTIEVEADSKNDAVAKAQASEDNRNLEAYFGSSEVYGVEQHQGTTKYPLQAILWWLFYLVLVKVSPGNGEPGTTRLS